MPEGDTRRDSELMLSVPSDGEVHLVIERGVAEVIPRGELESALKSGRRLRLKMGFDPTRPIVTLGWSVGLRKLRQLQELGHQVVVVIGDWTARIGDPSGMSQTRSMLSEEEVAANSERVLHQFYKVLDPDRTEIRRQSEWFDGFNLSDLVQLGARFTVAQLIQRDDFAKRLADQRPIGIHELLYPLLQAFDSVAVEADVELGGTDQKFNLLLGRELQTMLGQGSQSIILMPLLVGLDGKQKMSQSLGNYIGIDESPSEMFGKVMSIPDFLMLDYFELLTDLPEEELAEIRVSLQGRSANPMEIKARLAMEVTRQFHTSEAAKEASDEFRRVFRNREGAMEEMPEYGLTMDTVDQGDGRAHDVVAIIVRAGLAASATEARRLIRDGAVEVDRERVGGRMAVVEPGNVIRVGKHRFLRIVDGEKE